ncbi:MAG TPA: prepilin-type N-terminal cleavage/methylation domain-containing protein [Terracidiphilus sp.]|jgi:type IV pilus assembly protein PilA|nr:prepilin-type N-terminal cleavage/methylation domain-containing protein [Terracidiphilus sp.]
MKRKFSICGTRRGVHRPNEFTLPNGFTLMELLIVISIILILMLVAIPTAGKIRKHANELSAQKSLQTLEQAESMYESTYPTNGYACSLTSLGGDPTAGQSSPTAAGMINGELATGIKSGYIFTITNCTKVTINNGDRITSYTATAVPATPGKTGDRGFCLEAGGAMKADPTGGTNCTQMVQ